MLNWTREANQFISIWILLTLSTQNKLFGNENRHSNLSKMKNKILPTCLKENYGGSLGEFINTS